MSSEEKKLSLEVIEAGLRALKELSENPEAFASLTEEQRIAFLSSAGRLSRPTRQEDVRRRKAMKTLPRREQTRAERAARSATGIRSAREARVFSAPERLALDSRGAVEGPELKSPRNCYVCKAEYTRLHFFYDAMCPSCAPFNYEKRFQTADLTGQTALITGSRLKIGYQAALMMLRAGARVIATTRFPVDSAMRYAAEKDFEQWKDRLHIYGLDLRHTPSVELFCRYFEETYGRLDLLINNAAQTVRRPPGFYAHLMENEARESGTLPPDVRRVLGDFEKCRQRLARHPGRELSRDALSDESALTITWKTRTPGIGLRASAAFSQIPYPYDDTASAAEVFPKGELDQDLQQVDLRRVNSWRLRLGEIETAEMLELQLVNAVAPFVLCNKLIPLMMRENTGRKHIVNVSAMEGKFLRFKKADRHPHTNMAKAALNMLTHTAAGGLAKHGIYMNAVDTGWVTDEDPAHLAALKQEQHDFQPPLDIVDGAARVCDPFFDGIKTGRHWCGKFLKDYFPIDW